MPIRRFRGPGFRQPPSRSAAGLAREAVRTLSGGEPGLTLLGSRPVLDRTVNRILRDLAARPLVVVRFDADGGTPDGLRRVVGAACASRPRTDLLLVVENLERLSPALAIELAMAADAAIEQGGLRFLFTASDAMTGLLDRTSNQSLAECLRLRVSVPDGPPPTARIGLAGAALTGAAILAVLGWHRVPVAGSLRIATAVPRASVSAAGIAIPSTLPPAARAAGTRPPVALAALFPPARQPAAPGPTGATPASPPAPAETALRDPRPRMPDPVPVRPSASLLLVAGPRDTLPGLYRAVYRGNPAPPLELVAALNPIVRPGAHLVFPAPAAGWQAMR